MLSTTIVGFLSQWLLQALGFAIPLIYCLLFGALIFPIDPVAVMLLTWGGLRGGISIAMALSLPPSSERELIVAMTYRGGDCFGIVSRLSIG